MLTGKPCINYYCQGLAHKADQTKIQVTRLLLIREGRSVGRQPIRARTYSASPILVPVQRRQYWRPHAQEAIDHAHIPLIKSGQKVDRSGYRKQGIFFFFFFFWSV